MNDSNKHATLVILFAVETVVVLFILLGFALTAKRGEYIYAPNFVKDVVCQEDQLMVLVEEPDSSRTLVNTGYSCTQAEKEEPK